jgi:hypothetical protein
MEIYAIGIDLGKTVFHLVGVDVKGKTIVRKRCSRTQLLTYTANLQVKVIGMEARSGSHFLARSLREQGNVVRADASAVRKALCSFVLVEMVVSEYSILDLKFPLGQLNVITGADGWQRLRSEKSDTPGDGSVSAFTLLPGR